MILACWRLKQGSLDFKASLGYAGKIGKEVEGVRDEEHMVWSDNTLFSDSVRVHCCT